MNSRRDFIATAGFLGAAAVGFGLFGSRFASAGASVANPMNLSDAGSNAVKSDVDGSEIFDSGRRESWVPINSPGLAPPGHEGDRRPSLPLPNSRPMPSQSPYSLPSLQQHHMSCRCLVEQLSRHKD